MDNPIRDYRPDGCEGCIEYDAIQDMTWRIQLGAVRDHLFAYFATGICSHVGRSSMMPLENGYQSDKAFSRGKTTVFRVNIIALRVSDTLVGRGVLGGCPT